jgi:hypothetical protein
MSDVVDEFSEMSADEMRERLRGAKGKGGFTPK